MKGEVEALGKRMRKGASTWLRLGLGCGVQWQDFRKRDVGKEKPSEVSGK